MMASGKISIILTGLAFVTLLTALWFGRNEERQIQKKLQFILEGLLRTEQQVNLNGILLR